MLFRMRSVYLTVHRRQGNPSVASGGVFPSVFFHEKNSVVVFVAVVTLALAAVGDLE